MSGMDEGIRKSTAERVLAARLAAGLSKEAVARKAEVSTITYKRVEDGKGVQDASLARVLNALDLEFNAAGLDIEATLTATGEVTHVPVGAGVDAEVLAALAELEPEKIQRVKDFLRGIQAGE